MKFVWKCPKCEAPCNGHGKGGQETCTDRMSGRNGACMGLICECDGDQCPASLEPDHGHVLSNPCEEALCYHCGWGGTYPKAPKGLQAWEKKALAAGWVPPSERAKELEGLQ